MTKMIIDKKAGCGADEAYEIDRSIYQTIEELKVVAFECMNKDVYLVRVFEDDVELFTLRNHE